MNKHLLSIALAIALLSQSAFAAQPAQTAYQTLSPSPAPWIGFNPVPNPWLAPYPVPHPW